MFTEYLDVDITMLPRTGESVPFSIRAPGGDARGVLLLPTNDPRFGGLMARLGALDTDEEALTAIGQRLFDAVFQGQARDVLTRTQGALREGQGIRIRLAIPAEEPAVAALPWELIHDPDQGPLALQDAPIVRTMPLSARVPHTPPALPLRVLLTGAQTGPAADVAGQLREMQHALDTLGHHAQVVVEPHLTPTLLQRRLREGFHIWHFVGHGGSGDDGRSPGLELEDGSGGSRSLSAQQLAVLLARSGVALVVLDASTEGRLATGPFRQLAPALLKAQVPTVVAMQFSNPTASTQAFAGEFYRSLAQGFPIDACVTEGRKAVIATSGLGSPDWGAPMVFSRAPEAAMVAVPRPDTLGGIVALDTGRNGVAACTLVASSAAHGTILNPAARPALTRTPAPRPPRPLRAFLNRERELRMLASELQPGRGAWLHGPSGAGVSSLLRKAANAVPQQTFPDGVVALSGVPELATPDDIAQQLFERFYLSDTTVRIGPQSARSLLGPLQALFVLDRLPLAADELVALDDLLAGGALLIGADGRAPDTLLDVALAGLPRQEATKLLALEGKVELDLSSVILLDRICAALADVPMALLLVGCLIRNSLITLKQLVALLEENGAEPIALMRAARLSIGALRPAELSVLAGLVRMAPGGAPANAIAAASAVAAPALEPALERLCELRLVEGGGDRYAISTPGLRRALDRLLPDSGERRRAAAFFAGAAVANAANRPWLEAELGNLLPSARLLLEAGDPASAATILRAAAPVFAQRGMWGAWEQAANLAEQAGKASSDMALRAWAWHETGIRAGLLGNSATARSQLNDARQVRLGLGDSDGASVCLHNLRYLGLLPPSAARPPRPTLPLGRLWPAAAFLAAVLLLGLLWRGDVFSGPPAATPPTAVLAVAAATQPLVVVVPPTNTATAPPRATSTSAPTRTAPPSPSATAAANPTSGVASACDVVVTQLNLRSGPGTNYPPLGTLLAGSSVSPVARIASGEWLQVRAAGLATGWVLNAPQFIVCNGATAGLPIGQTPPTPRVVPTAPLRPQPTATPLPPTETPTEPPTTIPEPKPTDTPTEVVPQ